MLQKHTYAIIFTLSLCLFACKPEPNIKDFNQAIATNDLVSLEAIHSQGFINKIDNKKAVESAVIVAVKNSDAKLVSFLVDAGYPIENKDSKGNTPLLLASFNSNLDSLRILLGADVNVNVRNSSQATPLITAIKSASSFTFVNMLLNASADVNAKNKDGWTALHFTVASQDLHQQDQSDIAKALIKAGANIEAKTESGDTPLMLAAKNDKLDNVRILLDAGANVNARNNFHSSPLLIAIQESQSESLTKLLINAGADLNAVSDWGWGALHLTVNGVYEDGIFSGTDLSNIAKLLLDAGADIELKTMEGRSALALAAINKNPNTMKVLLDYGADVNTQDEWKWTPLMNAVFKAKSAALSKILLNAGADANTQNKFGSTALHLTVDSEDEAKHDLYHIAKVLLDSGANQEVVNNDGETPLMIAGKFNKPEVAKLLIEHGAYLNRKNTLTGKSALDYALENFNAPVISLLRSAGAETVLENN